MLDNEPHKNSSQWIFEHCINISGIFLVLITVMVPTNVSPSHLVSTCSRYRTVCFQWVTFDLGPAWYSKEKNINQQFKPVGLSSNSKGKWNNQRLYTAKGCLRPAQESSAKSNEFSRSPKHRSFCSSDNSAHVYINRRDCKKAVHLLKNKIK